MIELELAATRRVRFWLGELPDEARIPADGVVRRGTYGVSTTGEPAGTRAAAVELYMPMSPRRHYALLGGSLVPQGGQEGLAVEVSWGTWAEGAPSWALDSHKTRRGLTAVEARCVADVAIPYSARLGAGVKVTHALASDVDTSPVVLVTVMRVLLEVLVNPSVAESDESLRELVTKAIHLGILAAK